MDSLKSVGGSHGDSEGIARRPEQGALPSRQARRGGDEQAQPLARTAQNHTA